MNRIEQLEKQLEETKDWLEQMEILSILETLQLEAGIILPNKPPESPYICEGCSG